MNVSHKKVGLGLVAFAMAVLGTAALADKGGMNMPGMGRHMGSMGPMGMMRPMFDFAAADANKDGKVTEAEFAAARTAAVASIDTDKDGLISVDELAAAELKAVEGRIKDHAARMVKELDANGDAKLSAAELATPPVPPDAFARADTNKDGVIDQAEADAMAQHGPGGPDDQQGRGHHGKRHGGQNGPEVPPAN